MKKTHKLKTYPEYFEGLYYGIKTFEVRREDRDYEVGDTLVLEEYEPNHSCYTGRSVVREISHILRDTRFVPPGYCILSLRAVPKNEGGLYHKYDVYDAETHKPLHNCFVLRPDRDTAAVSALLTYAGVTTNRQLSADIKQWLNHLGVTTYL